MTNSMPLLDDRISYEKQRKNSRLWSLENIVKFSQVIQKKLHVLYVHTLSNIFTGQHERYNNELMIILTSCFYALQ